MRCCKSELIRELLFLLIVIYFSQGAIYPTGALIAKVALLLMLLISFSYFIISLLAPGIKKGGFYYAWAFLIFLNIFGFIFEGNYNGTHFSQLKSVLIALLPFFPFYYFMCKGHLKPNDLLRFAFLLLPIFILSFYLTKVTLAQNYNDPETIVTNTAYLFITLIPYLFLLGKRKFIAISLLLLLLFFTIQSAKRGALIAGLIGSAFFMFHLLSSIDPRSKVNGTIVGLTAVVIVSFYIYDFYISNEFLVQRMGEITGGGSGRNIIYSNLLESWYESDSAIKYLFGFGFVATIKNSGTGNLAHNDWLELLTNFGLLGVFIYLFAFYSAFDFIISNQVKKLHKLMMLCIISMWFFQTIVSMYYTSIATVMTSVLFAYLFGLKEYNRCYKL
jgi:hypothetical protein